MVVLMEHIVSEFLDKMVDTCPDICPVFSAQAED
jgi:hypothetical protein